MGPDPMLKPPPIRNGMSGSGLPSMGTKAVWQKVRSGQTPVGYVGDEILNALVSASGGIVYMRGNDFQRSYYLDRKPFYTFFLVPPFLIPENEWRPSFVEIGKSWVHREALDLLGYAYNETKSGDLSIPRDLEFV